MVEPILRPDEDHENVGLDSDDTVENNLALDGEADDLFQQLIESQTEVQRLIEFQKEEAANLGDMKNQLATELLNLQNEAWRLQVYAELEVLKRQIVTVNNLEDNLNNVENLLDQYEQGPNASSSGLQFKESDVGDTVVGLADEDFSRLEGAGDGAQEGFEEDLARYLAAVTERSAASAGGADQELPSGEDEGDEEDISPESVAVMQSDIDLELRKMFAQLQTVKAEAAQVSARKEALELELLALLAGDELEEDVEECKRTV